MIIYLLFITLIIVILLHFDVDVIAYIGNYEIFTNTKFIFLCFLVIFLLGLFFSYIFNILSITKKNRYINNLNNKYDKYLDYIYSSILFGVLGNTKKANSFLEQAKKSNYNKLTDLVSAFLNNDKKVGNGLFNYNVELLKAVQNNDNENILQYSYKILELQKDNRYCKELIYSVNKKEENWVDCLNLIGKNSKNRDELKFLYEKLSVDFYNKKDYNNSFNYASMFFKIDKDNLQNNTILIKSLKNIEPKNFKKLDRYIKKIWIHTPSDEIGDIFCQNDPIKAKKLLKLNKKDVKSIIYCCNILLKNNIKINNKTIKFLEKQNNATSIDLLKRLQKL